MNSGRVLVIVVAALATGALAGILFAPAKGKKTRKRLVTKGKDSSVLIKEEFKKMLELIGMKLEKLIDDIFFDNKKISHPENEVLQDAQII